MFKKALLAGFLAVSSVGASAEIVTIGDLSTDATYDIIADTVKGREYMRFDQFDMTYADTLASTQAGGQYEGWAIATSSISDDFINAIFSQSGENDCSTGAFETYGEICGTRSELVTNPFGYSHNHYYAYVSTHETTGRAPKDVGIARLNGLVRDYDDKWTFAQADIFNLAGSDPINFLLYRENAAHLGGFNTAAAANNTVVETPTADVPVSFPALGALFVMSVAGFRASKKGVK